MEVSTETIMYAGYVASLTRDSLEGWRVTFIEMIDQHALAEDPSEQVLYDEFVEKVKTRLSACNSYFDRGLEPPRRNG